MLKIAEVVGALAETNLIRKTIHTLNELVKAASVLNENCTFSTSLYAAVLLYCPFVYPTFSK